MNKKNLILLIALVIMIFVIIGLLVLNITPKKYNKNIDTKEKAIDYALLDKDVLEVVYNLRKFSTNLSIQAHLDEINNYWIVDIENRYYINFYPNGKIIKKGYYTR